MSKKEIERLVEMILLFNELINTKSHNKLINFIYSIWFYSSTYKRIDTIEKRLKDYFSDYNHYKKAEDLFEKHFCNLDGLKHLAYLTSYKISF